MPNSYERQKMCECGHTREKHSQRSGCLHLKVTPYKMNRVLRQAPRWCPCAAFTLRRAHAHPQ